MVRGQLGEFGDGGGMRGRRQERGSVRRGAKFEGDGGRETGKNCPGSGTGSREKFCGRRALLFNHNVIDIGWANSS